MSDKNFIFGYGSLISRESREKTGNTGRAIPVKIKGLKRFWGLVVPEAKLTALGVIPDKKSQCNGAIFSVSENDLFKFDKREIGYNRIKIKQEDIIFSNNEKIEGIVWVYVMKEEGVPNKQNPIVQSYVDVIIDGCIEYDLSFVKEFIITTHGWDSNWIDDRISPRYVRAKKDVDVQKIDNILREVIPEEFSGRHSN